MPRNNKPKRRRQVPKPPKMKKVRGKGVHTVHAPTASVERIAARQEEYLLSRAHVYSDCGGGTRVIRDSDIGDY